ncbi:MAG: hypothetical protein JWO38_7580 [Gemmataceae bacterium]|nr:hypothetical protein [Gemmataceae bacterium]
MPAGTDRLRLSPVACADGIRSPWLSNNPGVSDVLNNQADPTDPAQDIPTVDRNSLSAFGCV